MPRSMLTASAGSWLGDEIPRQTEAVQGALRIISVAAMT